MAVPVIHYHGTDMPKEAMLELAGRHFCVSYLSQRKRDATVAHQIGQGVMLDNGAFAVWRSGKVADWPRFYEWAAPWLDYHTTWAVIPDVIDGGEDANDALIAQWPHGAKGAPVWHMDETIGRLVRLASRFPRVCIGSTARYAKVGSEAWHGRMIEAMNGLCGDGPPPVWIHMLRGMALSGSRYPFTSVDSSDIARNHHRPQNSPRKMADRWDALQCGARWTVSPVQTALELVA